MAAVHQLIEPVLACRRLGHRIEHRNKVGPGQYEYCFVCSLAYEMAMQLLDDEFMADMFVQEIRRG